MTSSATATETRVSDQASDASAERHIVFRTRGRRQGPITRLMSPGDLGELVKPFVFLDYFESNVHSGRGFPAHPHSGIATHTTLIGGAIDYGDSTGKSGTLRAGSVEWMQAGGGVWHWGNPRAGETMRGYQLWIALPAAREHAPAESHYVDAAQIADDGSMRVLLGTYGNLKSAVPYSEPITYLHVKLPEGGSWTFRPNAGHEVAWLAVNSGSLRAAGSRLAGEMVVFKEGNAEIPLQASGPTEFVIGSAPKHPHPLVSGYYSVHTSSAALVRGEQNIDLIGGTAIVREAVLRTSR